MNKYLKERSEVISEINEKYTEVAKLNRKLAVYSQEPTLFIHEIRLLTNEYDNIMCEISYLKERLVYLETLIEWEKHGINPQL